jgi:SAM-dependent methyltransferase
MFIEESKWIADIISKYEKSFFPLLNLGSSTKEFREKIQPWINEIIFEPLSKKGLQVIHSDIKLDEGVDIAGDIFDEKFAKQLKDMNFQSVICSNVLEHIEDVNSFCNALEQIMPSGGNIIVTVPNLYPYHKDPIDTKFRPGVEDIVKLFPHCKLIEGVIYQCPRTHFSTLIRQPYTLLLTVKNWLIPRFGIKEWKARCLDIPNLFKKYKITVVLLRKK